LLSGLSSPELPRQRQNDRRFLTLQISNFYSKKNTIFVPLFFCKEFEQK